MNMVNTLLHEARQQGFTVLPGGKHIKLRAPSGALVVISRSTSDRKAVYYARKNMREALQVKA